MQVKAIMQAKGFGLIASKPQRALAPALLNLRFCFFAAVILLMALHTIERSGLPGTWAFAAAMLLLVALGVMLIIMDRTSEEVNFMLGRPLVSAHGGGALLGTLLAVMLPLLLRPADNAEAMAVLLGSCVGVAIAHIMVKAASRTKSATVGAALFDTGTGRGANTGFNSVLLGLLICGAAALAGYAAFPLAVRELSVLTGWSEQTSIAMSAALLIGGLVLGGGRSILAGLAVMTTLICATVTALLGEGLLTFGALPIPGIASEETLNAISVARFSWIKPGSQPPLMLQWPHPSAIFAGTAMNALVMAALLSAFVSRSLAPAIPLRRKTTAWSAVAVLVILTFAGIAIGGYAIEAAGSQLVGINLDRTPQRLLDTAAAGLIRICAAAPQTLEALRASCGVTGRGAVTTLGNLTLEPRYLWSGLPQSIGYSNTASAAPRSLPAVMAFITLFWSVWIMSLGLGRGVFAYRHQGPGQASQRLAFVRVAGAICIIALVVTTDLSSPLPNRQIWLLAGGAGLLALLLDFGLQRQRSVPQSEAEDAPQTPRRRKLPRGEAAQL